MTHGNAYINANESEFAITENMLVDMVISGAVYCTNGDAAHTSDYIDDRETVEEYWKYVDGGCTDFQEMIDALVYKGDDFNEYYDEQADEMINGSNAPGCITRYFDYAAWERDCSFDYHEGDRCLFAL